MAINLEEIQFHGCQTTTYRPVYAVFLRNHENGLHRNSKEIRDAHNWWLWHHKYGNIALSEEIPLEKERLPQGPVPVWIEAGPDVTDVEVLDMLKDKYTGDQSVTLTSIFPLMEMPAKIKEGTVREVRQIGEWCKAHGWKVMTQVNAQGTEHECVVLFHRPMSVIFPEHMSRARNALIIVTTLGDNTR